MKLIFGMHWSRSGSGDQNQDQDQGQNEFDAAKHSLVIFPDIDAIEILEDINLDNEAKEAEKFARKEAFGDDDKCYPPRR